MAIYKTSNPALNKKAFSNFKPSNGSDAMTIDGTVNKTLIMVILVGISAFITWGNVPSQYVKPILIVGVILGLIVALITIFKKEWSPVTAPIYSIVEGGVLGIISFMFEAMFPGIVMQAILLTFGILFVLLMLYKSKVIKATENFKLGIFAATGGIALVYIISMVLRMFGTDIPLIHESGLVGIGFSFFVVVIASLNLVLDFDFIESGVDNKVPKYMEWYGAFGLIVTLIWLYLELLRLLAKLKSR
ncbi:Bax inhibitor-1/YccA family protein [Candidatus Venteria ishoeyi]|uniref:Bax inhibitor 1 like protein n=1 Tax=Candidatus Venteria ishoeyi TaxID=1899563 RepID=A0A1H6F773_9GAMM|nr:Bax inhibitor-1/YccA family protein [Candidatus Venteria ishoeyi]SEH05169.1 Bax inhibitor 1 like protein [Candidatus Venteria ishoeyi]